MEKNVEIICNNECCSKIGNKHVHIVAGAVNGRGGEWEGRCLFGHLEF